MLYEALFGKLLKCRQGHVPGHQITFEKCLVFNGRFNDRFVPKYIPVGKI